MQRPSEIITQGWLAFSLCFKFASMCFLCIQRPLFIKHCLFFAFNFCGQFLNFFSVGLVSLWRFSLTERGGSQEPLSELIYWKDQGFVRFPFLREIITVSTCFVLHPQRWELTFFTPLCQTIIAVDCQIRRRLFWWEKFLIHVRDYIDAQWLVISLPFISWKIMLWGSWYENIFQRAKQLDISFLLVYSNQN